MNGWVVSFAFAFALHCIAAHCACMGGGGEGSGRDACDSMQVPFCISHSAV